MTATQNDTPYISTSEAAMLVNKSPRQIQREIKDGSISAERDKKGSWRINKAEFFRVYPDAFQRESTATNNDIKASSVATSQNNEISLMKALIDELKDSKERLEKQLEQANAEKTILFDTLKNSQRLIEHSSKKGFFRKIFA